MTVSNMEPLKIEPGLFMEFRREARETIQSRHREGMNLAFGPLAQSRWLERRRAQTWRTELIRWEIPRLCRGGSRSLPFSGVCFSLWSDLKKPFPCTSTSTFTST